ncbi:sulfotransferase [Streptomyces sp. LN785]|uniref:sulfotransferase n=1 Tax=Streptomyces sp. LN785 TaxID=3112983 RepID=UPI00371C1BC1
MTRGREREYQRLLEHYRESRTRPDVGLAVRPTGRGGPRPKGLRQADVDEALHGGSGVYQKLATGRLHPSPDLFMRVARLLRFSDHHLRVAHVDLYRTDPVLPSTAPPSPHWQRVVDGQSEMACVLTPAGSLVACNDAFSGGMFSSGRAPSNLWRWALFSEEARDQVLVKWEEEWAPRILAEFALARVRHPSSETLREIHLAVRNDPRLREMEEAETGFTDTVLALHHRQFGHGEARFMKSTADGLGVVTVLFDLAGPAS